MPFAIRALLLLQPARHDLLKLAAGTVAAVALAPVALLLLLTGSPAPGTGSAPFSGGPWPPMPSWVVTQPFGCTTLAFEPPGPGCAHFHSGIDLAAPEGSPVRAVLPGIASVVADAGGYGLHVLVRLDERTTLLYGHLGSVAVSNGASVFAGALLGGEGTTGLSTGPHLHLEVRRDGRAIDPVAALPELFRGAPDGGLPIRSALDILPGANHLMGEPT